MVAHVLYQEGGSSIGPQAMRNIAYVIRNRVGVPEFASTILGVISQGNGDHFNAWYAPSARESGFYWKTALEIADSLLAGTSLGASPKMTSKTRYFVSCGDRQKETPGDSNHVHYDEGGGRAQYYYEHLPNPLTCVAVTTTPKP